MGIIGDAFLLFFLRLEKMVCKSKKYLYFRHFSNIFDKIGHFFPGFAFLASFKLYRL